MSVDTGDFAGGANISHITERIASRLDAADPDRKPPTGDPCEQDPPGRKHSIEIRPGQTPEHADEAEEILIEHDWIFQRSGMLVRIAAAKAETVSGIQRPASGTVITPVDADFLLDRLARLIVWKRWNARKEKFVASNAPRSVALSLLSRAGAWSFPPLVGVVTAPTLRPDGSVLEKPGYDPTTGLLFVNGGEVFPPIPTRPGRKEGQRALAFLDTEVLGEFQFAEPYDRSAALSAILTAIARPTLPAAPLHAISAPKPGTGKSLLAECVALIAAGKNPTTMSFTEEPEEQRKRILSILMSGDPIINLDNLEVPLASAALCSVLTSESYTDRKLGSQTNTAAPTNALWLATGNNLVIRGDLTRRTVLVNLDPACERPEEREFSRDLKDWIPRHRPALVVAALVALRSYIVADKPTQAKPLGGFVEWSELVRSALIWLGQPDPLAGRDQMEATDPVRALLKQVLLAWYATFETRPATAKDAILRAMPDYQTDKPSAPELYEVLSEEFADRHGKLSSRRLGEFLSKYHNRIEAGVKISDDGNYGHAKKWRLTVTDQTTLDRELRKFCLLGK